MPYAPPRPCNFAGCPKKQHAAYCDEHQKRRAREYENSRKGHNEAYWSPKWKRARATALKRDDYVCQRCLKEVDRVVPATQVHHIEKFDKDAWQTDPKFTSLDNLESICASHHSRIDGWGRSKQGLKKEPPRPGSTADFEARFGIK